MSNTNMAIQEAVESFVEQLRGLIQQAALESVQAALNGGSPARRGAKPGRSPAVAPRGRQKGAKRTPEELEALVKKFHAYIAKNPGQRIEQIGKTLGVATKELVLPVKKLVSEKSLLATSPPGAGSLKFCGITSLFRRRKAGIDEAC